MTWEVTPVTDLLELKTTCVVAALWGVPADQVTLRRLDGRRRAVQLLHPATQNMWFWEAPGGVEMVTVEILQRTLAAARAHAGAELLRRQQMYEAALAIEEP